MFSLIVILCHIFFSTLSTPVFSLPFQNQIDESINTVNDSAIQNAIINELMSHAINNGAPSQTQSMGSEDGPIENRQFSPVIIKLNGPLRIWALGSVSKFPPFLEHFVQRIQSYFSIYKYQDLSRPVEEIETEKVSEPNVEVYEENVDNEQNEGESSVANEEIIESETEIDDGSKIYTDDPNDIEK